MIGIWQRRFVWSSVIPGYVKLCNHTRLCARQGVLKGADTALRQFGLDIILKGKINLSGIDACNFLDNIEPSSFILDTYRYLVVICKRFTSAESYRF